MIGSPGVAAWIALWSFWILLFIGLVRGELGAKGSLFFILLWVAGFVGARFMFYGFLFTPYVAALDIALVFAIFKGDLRLT